MYLRHVLLINMYLMYLRHVLHDVLKTRVTNKHVLDVPVENIKYVLNMMLVTPEIQLHSIIVGYTHPISSLATLIKWNAVVLGLIFVHIV